MAFDVVVIGAGISGASAAYELQTAGLQTALVDRFGPAAMASGWTLAGVRQSGRHPAELPLATAAVELWPGLAERLGGPTHYRRCGNLRLARTEDEVEVIRALVRDQTPAGLEVVLLDGARAVREAAPAVAETVLAASFCATDGHADPTATVSAFVEAAKRAGVVCRFGERVTAIATDASGVTGITTDQGTIATRRVVVAAGIFGNELLSPLGLEVPLEVPMVTLLRSVPGPSVLEPVIGVANADCAGRQERDGRFRVTSGRQLWHGRIEGGARPVVRPTAAALAVAVERFGAVVPAFKDALIETFWAGLIDQTPDHLPVLERSPAVDGLTVAMGFSGHGFALGPLTGQIIRDLVMDRPSNMPLAPFRSDRFSERGGAVAAAGLHG